METVIRVAIIYLLILIGLRILGKREFSQLSSQELVTLLLIPELVSPALTRQDDSLVNAGIAAASIFSLVFLTSVVSHRVRRMETVLSGKPTLLVAHGDLLVDNLNRERISPSELYTEMHKVGLERLAQVRWAVLETDGRIAIVPEEHQGNAGSSSSSSSSIAAS